jgi:hypothetical protein
MTGHRSTSSMNPRQVEGGSTLAHGAVMAAAVVVAAILASFVSSESHIWSVARVPSTTRGPAWWW